MTEPDCPYVSRGGLKLAAALDAFDIDPSGLTCADLGCNVGGYTDCLLQRGAARVYAVDTSYGTFAWKLRNDPRVVTLERTNVLHFDPLQIEGFVPARLIAIDLGWTVQSHAIPAALRWLDEKGRDRTRIVSLIKPHYEASALGQLPADAPRQSRGKARRHVLSPDEAQAVVQQVLDAMPALGVRVLGSIASPIRGGGKRHRSKAGNVEYLACLAPVDG